MVIYTIKANLKRYRLRVTLTQKKLQNETCQTMQEMHQEHISFLESLIAGELERLSNYRAARDAAE